MLVVHLVQVPKYVNVRKCREYRQILSKYLNITRSHFASFATDNKMLIFLLDFCFYLFQDCFQKSVLSNAPLFDSQFKLMHVCQVIFTSNPLQRVKRFCRKLKVLTESPLD